MVYLYVKQSEFKKRLKEDLSLEEIERILKEIGMDVKGLSDEQDPQMKVEITSEKLDLVSSVGLTRAINFYLQKEEVKNYEIEKGENRVIIDKSANESRPKVVSAIVRDFPITDEVLEEIIALQEKIHESFGRNRKKGAIGIYPVDEIKFPITYKSLNPNEIKFMPLETDVEMSAKEILEKHPTGKKFKHLLENYSKYPVFIDANNNFLSMPPIINSQKTGRVTTEHKDLFIECSGYNIEHLDNILKNLITVFIDLGGKAESIKVEYEDGEIYELNLDNKIENVNLNYVRELIGVDFKDEQIEDLLQKAMFKLKSFDKKSADLEIEIPCFRTDIWNDVDIADDIARAYGYNNIVPQFPQLSSVGGTLEFNDFKDDITKALVNMGFLEVYSFILTSTKDQFDNLGLKKDDFEFIKLLNSAEQGNNMCRISLFSELMKAFASNKQYAYPQKIFENGFTIIPDERADTGAKNVSKLCVSIANHDANYTQIKGIFDMLMNLLELEVNFEKSDLSYLIEGRRADILFKDEKIGFIGEVHPQVIENFNLSVPIASFEIDLSKIWEILNN